MSIAKFDTYQMRDYIAERLINFVTITVKEKSVAEDWCFENVGKYAPFIQSKGMFNIDTSKDFDWGIVCFEDDGYKYRVYFKDAKDAVMFKLRFG